MKEKDDFDLDLEEEPEEKGKEKKKKMGFQRNGAIILKEVNKKGWIY